MLIRFDLVARGRATGIEAVQKAYSIWEVDDGLLRGIRFFFSDEDADRRVGGGREGRGLIIY